MNQKTISLGTHYENAACDFLLKHNLTLIEKNFRCRVGEIDLIMRHGLYFVFVEVRYRKNLSFGDGVDSVHHFKQQKIIRAAQTYLVNHHLTEKVACRFDVVSVSHSSSQLQFEWIQNAFVCEDTP